MRRDFRASACVVGMALIWIRAKKAAYAAGARTDASVVLPSQEQARIPYAQGRAAVRC